MLLEMTSHDVRLRCGTQTHQRVPESKRANAYNRRLMGRNVFYIIGVIVVIFVVLRVLGLV
jgi:hypothetical protein